MALIKSADLFRCLMERRQRWATRGSGARDADAESNAAVQWATQRSALPPRNVAACTAGALRRKGHRWFTEIADAVRKQQNIGIRFVRSSHPTEADADDWHSLAHEQSWRGTCVDGLQPSAGRREQRGPKRGDSNPRATCTASRLSVGRLKPLSHAPMACHAGGAVSWSADTSRRPKTVDINLLTWRALAQRSAPGRRPRHFACLMRTAASPPTWPRRRNSLCGGSGALPTCRLLGTRAVKRHP